MHIHFVHSYDYDLQVVFINELIQPELCISVYSTVCLVSCPENSHTYCTVGILVSTGNI